VTRLAAEGSLLVRGDEIFAVDNHPRVLMYGSTPAWRDLSAASSDGVDVYELEANLVALGYDPDHEITIDDTFTDATAVALQRWQKDHGYVETGILSLGQVFFLPGPSRIGTHSGGVGSVVRDGSAITEVTVTRAIDTAFTPGPGTVDAIAPTGTVVKSGSVLFRVNGQPTVALIGTTDITRDLKIGVSDGEDVRVLEQALVDLGFDPSKAIVVDNTFDSATEEAVKRWQSTLALDQDGVLAAGRVLVVPSGLAVGDHHLEGGGEAVAKGTAVLDLTVSYRQVTSKISVSARGSLKVGDPVQVKFADGTLRPATITDIGAVATKDAKDATAAPTVPLTVKLQDSAFEPNLVSTPVDVLIIDSEAKGALAVPTDALVSLKEGGFAVQLADANKLVAVKPGLYADSWVQVTSDGIAAGTMVLVPA